MKNPKAAELVRVRLKYDWIVLFCGLLIALLQYIYQGDLPIFAMVVVTFAWVEIFEVQVYRNLKNGGVGFHSIATRSMDQDTSFGDLLMAVILEFLALFTMSLFFLIKLFE